MFLDQKLNQIREEKARLGTCCDLRRRLVQIEFRAMVSGAISTASNVVLGLTVVQQIVQFLRDRKDSSQ